MSGDSSRYVDLWINHNNFLWTQFRALPFVEAVILAGTYKLHKDGETALALAVLGFGSLLLLVLFLMIRRHIQHASKFREMAGDDIPNPEAPLFGIRSDTLAVALPIILVLFHVVLVLVSV